MTDLQHGLRVDPTRWEAPKMAIGASVQSGENRRPAFRWQAVVAEHRRQKSWRYRIAQWLRRLVTWIEPK